MLKLAFEPATCVIDTPTVIKAVNEQDIDSQGRWVRVRVYTKNLWLKSRLARGCLAHLIKVEIEQGGEFRPTHFIDTLPLRWSSQLSAKATNPLNIASDVAQFVDVLAADRHTPTAYSLQTFVPLYCRDLFDERPKALRLTVLVTSENAAAARAQFVFRWNGQWNNFEASAVDLKHGDVSMTKDRKIRYLNLAGLLLGLFGVVILFRYGMPFHVPTGGAVSIITEGRDANAIALERCYEILGYIGLGFLILGTFLQMWAAWLSGSRDG